MFKRHLSSAFAVVLAALALTACSSVAPVQKTSLWKVTSSAHRTLYITGDTQLLSQKDYPLPAPITQAFSESGESVLEGSPGADKQKVQALVMKLGLLPSGQTLGGKLNATQLKLVKNAFSELDVPFANVQPMRPWLAALVMLGKSYVKLGVKPSNQMTEYFYKQANAQKMPVTPLETGVGQIKMFAAIPEKIQVVWLTSEAGQITEMLGNRNERVRVLQAWRSGDTKVMSEYLVKSFRGHPELYGALVTDRNQRWLKTLEADLNESGKPVFVVVGTGHLVGPGNLLSALRKAGYHVTQL